MPQQGSGDDNEAIMIYENLRTTYTQAYVLDVDMPRSDPGYAAALAEARRQARSDLSDSYSGKTLRMMREAFDQAIEDRTENKPPRADYIARGIMQDHGYPAEPGVAQERASLDDGIYQVADAGPNGTDVPPPDTDAQIPVGGPAVVVRV